MAAISTDLKCLRCGTVISLPSDTENCPFCLHFKFLAQTVEPGPYHVSADFLRRNRNASETVAAMLLGEDRALHLVTTLREKGYLERDRFIYIEIRDDFDIDLVEVNRYLSAQWEQTIAAGGTAPALVLLPVPNPSDYKIETQRQVIMLIPAPGNYDPEHFYSVIPQEKPPPPVHDSFFLTLKPLTETDGVVCTVCFDDVAEGEDIKKLPCGDPFHDICIRKWLKITARCPNCQFPFTTKCADYNDWLNYKKGGGDGAGGGSAGGSTSINA